MGKHAKHLLLDFGGVISKTLFEDLAAIEAAFDLAPGTLAWRGPFGPDADLLWSDMQDGKISEREYWQIRVEQLSELVAQPLTIPAVLQRSRGDNPDRFIRPEAVDAIRRAKAAGRQVMILSNELVLFYGAPVVDRISILSDIDGIIDASYTMVLKPDPRAYRMAMAALDVPADEIVFVDDQPRNVSGAEAAGLRAIQFDVMNPAFSYRRAMAELGLDLQLVASE